MYRSAAKYLPEADVKGVIAPFALAFVILFLYAIQNNAWTFPGDANQNWLVAKSLADPAFHYQSYVEYHGFVLFAICALIYRLSMLLGTDAVLTLRFFGALLFAFLAAVSLPTMLARLSGITPTFWRRLLCVVLVYFFFRGYFLYPSDDPLALLFILLSINSMTGPGARGIGRSIITGLWFGLAIYTRSNYIIAAPLIVWLVLTHRDVPILVNWKMAGRGLALVLAVGCTFAANTKFNDYLANRYGGVRPSSTTASFKLHIVQAELTWGMRNQRVIWNAGGGNYPGSLQFSENRGKAVLHSAGLDSGWLDFSQYVDLAYHHPIDFALIYLRHAFNGLDASYPTIYVQDVGRRSVLFSLLNYFLIFSSLYALYENRRRLRHQWPVLLALALPALSCVPFLIEPRFFMPLSITLLAYPIFANSWARYLHKPKVGQTLLATAFVVGCFGLSAHIFYSSLQEMPPPFHAQLPFHTLP